MANAPPYLQIELLSRYLTAERPFGPFDEAIFEHADAASYLYCDGVSSLKDEDRTTFVVGRMGSGKSAVLNAVARGRGHTALQLEINSRRLMIRLSLIDNFDLIYKTLEHAGLAQPHVDTERVSMCWQELILQNIAKTVVGSVPEASKGLGNDLAKLRSFSESASSSHITDQALQILRGSLSPTKDRPSLNEVRNSIAACLAASGDSYFVTLDHKDNYSLQDRLFVTTLAGLWRAISRLNDISSQLRVCTSIPTEILAPVHIQVATPVKDMAGSSEQIHWRVTDLFQLATYRFCLFLQIHAPAISESRRLVGLRRRCGTLPGDPPRECPVTREEIIGFWSKFTSRAVGGLRENPLTYLARHTQLTPRQVLMMFTEIAVASYHRTGGWGFFPEEEFVAGVEIAGRKAADEVFYAFKDAYPLGRNACISALSNLDMITSIPELEQRWDESARETMRSMDLSGFSDFIRMAQTMGILGRIVEPGGERATSTSRRGQRTSAKRLTDDPYLHAEFRYTKPIEIVRSDRIAIHPLFSWLFNLKQIDRVLPIGSDIYADNEEMRQGVI